MFNFEPFEIENFEGNLQFPDFDKPFYMQYKIDKFWEISLKGLNLKNNKHLKIIRPK